MLYWLCHYNQISFCVSGVLQASTPDCHTLSTQSVIAVTCTQVAAMALHAPFTNVRHLTPSYILEGSFWPPYHERPIANNVWYYRPIENCLRLM